MREHFSSGSPFEAAIGFSRAVRTGDRILVSGTAPIWPDGSCDHDPEVQALRCFEIVAGALAEAGARLEDVVRTRMFITSPTQADAVGRAHAAVFRDIRPAATMVVVAGLLDPRWCVEIEAEAVADGTNKSSGVPVPDDVKLTPVLNADNLQVGTGAGQKAL